MSSELIKELREAADIEPWDTAELLFLKAAVALESQAREIEGLRADSARKQALIDALVELSEVRMSREERQLRLDAALQAKP